MSQSQRNHSFIEHLEGRQMLSAAHWGAQAEAIGQDLAAQQFPQSPARGTRSWSSTPASTTTTRRSAAGGATRSSPAGTSNNDSNPMSDTNAHGTGVAGAWPRRYPYVFKGGYSRHRPGANLIALRENNTTASPAALQWVIDNKANTTSSP